MNNMINMAILLLCLYIQLKFCDLSPVSYIDVNGQDERDDIFFEKYGKCYLGNLYKKKKLDLLQSPNVDIYEKIKIIKENEILKVDNLVNSNRFEKIIDDFNFEIK